MQSTRKIIFRYIYQDSLKRNENNFWNKICLYGGLRLSSLLLHIKGFGAIQIL